MKQNNFTCNEVTCLANLSTFALLFSLAASRVTISPRHESLYNRDGGT